MRRKKAMAAAGSAPQQSYAESGAASQSWFKLDDPSGQRYGRRPAEWTHEFDSWDYVKNPQAVDSEKALTTQGQLLAQQGTRTTRFHQGFNRRNQTHIRQDAQRVGRMAEKEAAQVKFEPKRTQRLAYLDTGYNQFNIITGAQNPSAERRVRPQAKHVDDTKSRSLIHEGSISLRDSSGRFFGPPSGCQQPAKHDRRVQGLVADGLKQSLYSSELGVGRFEMPSWGTADALGMSKYGGHSLASRPPTGLSSWGGGGSQRGGTGESRGGYGGSASRGGQYVYGGGGGFSRPETGASRGGGQQRPETGRSVASRAGSRAVASYDAEVRAVRELR